MVESYSSYFSLSMEVLLTRGQRDEERVDQLRITTVPDAGGRTNDRLAFFFLPSQAYGCLVM